MEQNVKDGDRNVEPPRAACRVPPRAGTPCDIREGGPITVLGGSVGRRSLPDTSTLIPVAVLRMEE
jgi:hypothetical protein